MSKKLSKAETYSEEESARRFEAALRGARLASPQPMKDIPRKRAKGAKKPKPAQVAKE
jgi:hypothetical protein